MLTCSASCFIPMSLCSISSSRHLLIPWPRYVQVACVYVVCWYVSVCACVHVCPWIFVYVCVCGGVKVEATRPDVLHVCMLVHIHIHVSVRYLPVATPHHLGCLSVAPSIDWEGRKSYTISLLVVQGQNVRHLPLGSYPAFPHP